MIAQGDNMRPDGMGFSKEKGNGTKLVRSFADESGTTRVQFVRPADTDLVVAAICNIETEVSSLDMPDSTREAVMAAILKVLGR